MHNILVINAGSSSIKFQLFDMDEKVVIAKGIVDRIGQEGSQFKYKSSRGNIEAERPIPSHDEGIKLVLNTLVHEEYGVLRSMDEIKAVGHRVLHGGDKFSGSVLANQAVLDALEEFAPLGPLHNIPQKKCVEACMKIMPNTPMVTVFDTAFHQTMPPKAYLYGLPYEDYEKHKIRRYGFHGTSHRYVSRRTAELLGKRPEECRIIVCHLGNGSSISAVDRGKCVDTSMGLTPLEGLIMGTRCGSIDPAIVTKLMEWKGLSAAEVDEYLNKKCGVLGISGFSSDFRDLGAAAEQGNKRALLALETFSYSVKKYIGAYAAVMNGVDAIAFTGGIGENDEIVRRMVMTDMDYLGINFDFELNDNFQRGIELELTKPGSTTRVFIVPTDEELTIATETFELTH
ncbi:MAG: acetate kinase [Christensenellales bacterium]|jgi:acetate kinase